MYITLIRWTVPFPETMVEPECSHLSLVSQPQISDEDAECVQILVQLEHVLGGLLYPGRSHFKIVAKIVQLPRRTHVPL